MSKLTKEQCRILAEIDGVYPHVGADELLIDGWFTAKTLRHIADIVDPPKPSTRQVDGSAE